MPLQSIVVLLSLTFIAAMASPHANGKDLADDGAGPKTIDLSGSWQVRLGNREIVRADGVSDSSVLDDALQWRHFVDASAQQGSLPVELPGTLRDSGLGDRIGPDTKWIASPREQTYDDPRFQRYQTADNFKTPFWWQPKLRFVGAAWYQREFEIPPAWHDKRVVLKLERPHWRTRVWVDGQLVGKNDSLSTAHVYELNHTASPGSHTLTIGIDNGIRFLDVGENAHSVSDHTQTAWHGIAGDINLTATPKVAIQTIQVHPDSNQVQSRWKLINATKQPAPATLRVQLTQNRKTIGQAEFAVVVPPGEQEFSRTIPLSTAPLLWDEFEPNLCELTATLVPRDGEPVRIAQKFGFRWIAIDGKRMTLNNRPLFLRGTLECCIFPLTGYPPTDVDAWKRIIRVCKAHGLNHIRFHSWCPPEAAFDAADELGFYYQVECSSWPNQSTNVSRGHRIDEWLDREAERIVESYANHPSFVLLASGNEPAGPRAGAEYFSNWVTKFRQDGRHLVTSASGWPVVPESDFHVIVGPRMHQGGNGLQSRINARRPETITNYMDIVDQFEKPIIGHEIGQWCAFPNFDEINKYRGSIKATNLEVFEELLADAGMLDQAKEFLMASGRWQSLVYKEEVESALRTPGFGGFQMLDLHDFPGQGTATVGILDAFWDAKPYISASEFRRFCGPIVPLVEMPKRIWIRGQTFDATVKVSHFGQTDLIGAVTKWTIADADSGVLVAEGTLPSARIAKDGLRQIGKLQVPLALDRVPAKLRLTVSIKASNQRPETLIENDWDIWVYEAPASEQSHSPDLGLMTCERLTADAINQLDQGGRVLLLPTANSINSDVKTGMSPIFWNTIWTRRKPPHTLGILSNPEHPLFRRFPTDAHSNWQWWGLMRDAGAMDLSDLPVQTDPIIQLIPDWSDPKRLSTVFECRVGEGKLLVCSMNVSDRLNQRPVAKQFRQSMNDYLSSGDFNPKVQLSLSQLKGLFHDIPHLPEHGSLVDATDHANAFPASNGFDGDPSTIWHTPWLPRVMPHPHHLMVDVGGRKSLAGLRYTPRQDKSNGRIAKYQIKVSQDGETWKVAAAGAFEDSIVTQVVHFEKVHSARYVQLISMSEVNGLSITSLADFDVILSDGNLEERTIDGS